MMTTRLATGTGSGLQVGSFFLRARLRNPHTHWPETNSRPALNAYNNLIISCLQFWHYFAPVSLTNFPPMLVRNYYRTAVRQIARSRFHSLLNITGLSVGIAFFLLIGAFAWSE